MSTIGRTAFVVNDDISQELVTSACSSIRHQSSIRVLEKFVPILSRSRALQHFKFKVRQLEVYLYIISHNHSSIQIAYYSVSLRAFQASRNIAKHTVLQNTIPRLLAIKNTFIFLSGVLAVHLRMGKTYNTVSSQ